MPEGDTIATYARALRPWLQGARVERAECRWPRVVDGLDGAHITAIETRGKHLLIGFDDRTWLRVHLKMTGTWHRYDPGERWRVSRGDLAVALHTAEHVVVCFRAPEVERIDDRILATHPVLAALGPDLMRTDADLDAVVARARASGARRLADLLLDQRVACGLGNVYKSELCFLFGLDPLSSPDDLDDQTLRQIYARGGELLRENVGRARNTTGRRNPGLFVYGRAGRPCIRCRSRIRSHAEDAADRVTYSCPDCQRTMRRRSEVSS